MPFNTEQVHIAGAGIAVVGEPDRSHFAFSVPRPVPPEGAKVAPVSQELYVVAPGATRFVLTTVPAPEAIKFITVNGVPYFERGNFQIDLDVLTWQGDLTLKPTDRIRFWSFGDRYARELVRVDRIVVGKNGDTGFSLSGVSRGGVGEVVLNGRTYFAGASFTLSGDRLFWTENLRSLRAGDVLTVLFYLQENAARMHRYRELAPTTPGQTTFTLEVAPSDARAVRLYLDDELHHANVSGSDGSFNVVGRQLVWTGPAIARGRRVRVVIPTASVVTQDPPHSTGSPLVLSNAEPAVTQDGQTLIPVANPPRVLSKSMLIASGLVYIQGQGYTLDAAGNIQWGNSPALDTMDTLRLIGFNDQGAADGTVLERLPIAMLNGVPTPASLTYEPADPSKVLLVVSSRSTYGGLALFTGGHFTVAGKTIQWGGQLPAFPLTANDTLIAIYYKDLAIASSMIYDRLVLTPENVARRSYDLGVVPQEPQRSIWTVNGEVMRWGVDYTISGSTLWYIGAFELRPGDEVGIVTR